MFKLSTYITVKYHIKNSKEKSQKNMTFITKKD